MPGYTDHYFQDYNLYSVNFGDYNSWDTWHLIPTSRPSISAPEAKTNYVEVPGSNYKLDLSEALTNFPLYGNRSGSISFMCLDTRPWKEIYESLLNSLHNKKMNVVLSDDPDWYYTGRITVGEWQTNKDYSTIDISYDFEPFKTAVNPTYVTIDENDFTEDSGGRPLWRYMPENVSKLMQVTSPIIWANGSVQEPFSQRMFFRNTEISYTSQNNFITTTKKVFDRVLLTNFTGDNYLYFTFYDYQSGSDLRMMYNEKRM